MKKKRSFDYVPIKITEQEYRTLRQIDESKKLPKWIGYELYKWNIYIKCNPPDEIGYCFTYRKCRKLWFYILTWIPAMVCRFWVALWEDGLSNFSYYRITYDILTIKNGDACCNGIFDSSFKEEFKRIDLFWGQKHV